MARIKELRGLDVNVVSPEGRALLQECVASRITSSETHPTKCAKCWKSDLELLAQRVLSGMNTFNTYMDLKELQAALAVHDTEVYKGFQKIEREMADYGRVVDPSDVRELEWVYCIREGMRKKIARIDMIRAQFGRYTCN
jgi:hypothetical protein